MNKIQLKTISGVSFTKRLTRIKLKIFNIEKEVDVFIIENEDSHEFLIGIDVIKEFKLRQDENLNISQRQLQRKDIIEINFNEHIKEKDFKIDINHLDNERKIKIEQMIDEYKTIFAKDKYDIGTVKDYEARIDLLVDKFCSKRPYRCTIEDRKEIVTKLLEKNLFEVSYSLFAAPVTLALTKDEGKTRLCHEFRDLNKIVTLQAQPFPLIDDLIITPKEDRNKTGFISQEGHYQWICLPFGLKTASAIFQRKFFQIY